MRKHKMEINPKYFNYMKYGTKYIETRLNDSKRKKVEVGDIIVFTKKGEKEEIERKVFGICIKKSFEESVKGYPTSAYADKSISEKEYLDDLKTFYPEKKVKKKGVRSFLLTK